MKYCALSTQKLEKERLQREFEAADVCGTIRLGENCLFFKRLWKVYYIAYTDINRYFRRVMLVPAGLKKEKGELALENLVICDQTGEVAQIQIPGTKAAKSIMDELKNRAPHAAFVRPEK